MRTLTIRRIAYSNKVKPYKKIGKCLGCGSRFVVDSTKSKYYCPNCFGKLLVEKEAL